MATKRNLVVDFCKHCIGVLRALHGRKYVAWSNGTDPDFRGELKCHCLGQFDYSGFCGIVVGIIRLADDAIGGCSLQNHSAATLPHVACRSLGDVENSGEIDGENTVPLSGSDVEKVVANADACVVDEDVDASHDANRVGERRLNLLKVRNIGL